ncbi:MAG: beta-lactamase [Actinotalea sp.]|nr:beta-lactamase [Actinotalea sp.]
MSSRRWGAAAAALILAVSACSAAPEPDPTPVPSPAPSVEAASLAQQVEEVFTSESGIFQGYGDVRAFLVVVDGQTLVERYDESTPADTHDVFSVTKSVMSLLIGIAVEQGDLKSVDQTLAELLPSYAPVMTPEVAGITLEQVLTMTAGIRVDLPVIDETHDPVEGALTGTRLTAPGERFMYSDYGANLLSAILIEATGVSTLEYAREHLFGPLGIVTEPTTEMLGSEANQGAYEQAGFAWPVDADGRHLGFAHLKLTPPDMVAIGQLMLNGGVWEGEQVVPAQWVADSTSRHVEEGAETAAYGYLWWVFPAAGHDAFAAVGYGGQLIEVVPDLDLIVVAATSVPDDESPSMDAEPLSVMVAELIIPALEP